MRPAKPTNKTQIYLLAFLMLSSSCAGKGLLTEKYGQDFYRVPKRLPDKPIVDNQKFIVISDNQSGWRAYDKFLKKDNWVSYKMFIFPFYQIYLLGNGIVGTVNWFRYVPDYGAEERRMIRDAIYTKANETPVAFVLNLGDIAAHDGRRPSHWATFLKEYRMECPLLDEIPFLPVIGNHEVANDTVFGYPNYQAIFDYPRFYVIEFSDAALFVLDSSLLMDQKQLIQDDVQDALFEKWFASSADELGTSWLEKQLTSYDKTFKLVAMHHPPITFGKHLSDWVNSSYGRDLIGKRQKLLKLFQEHNIQLVLSGHDHLYQHNVLRSESGNNIHFLVGGGGGAPLQYSKSHKTIEKLRQDYKNYGLDIDVLTLDSIHHYNIVEISHNKLTINVIEVTGNDDNPTRLIETIEIEPN